MARSIALIFVLVCVVASGLCDGVPEDKIYEVPTDANVFLPPAVLSSSQVDINRQDSILEDEEETEWPMLHREKRGLGKRMKKLGRSIDRSFRKVRDSALPAIGAGLGASVASG